MECSLPRQERAKVVIHSEFTPNQQAFLNFVLAHYIEEGVEKLDLNKLSPLLILKYHSLPDAMTKLGKPEEINRMFTGFQKHLYTQKAPLTR